VLGVAYMKVTTLATFHAPMSVLNDVEVWNIDHLQDRYHYFMIIIIIIIISIILPTILMLPPHCRGTAERYILLTLATFQLPISWLNPEYEKVCCRQNNKSGTRGGISKEFKKFQLKLKLKLIKRIKSIQFN
jgi:hypothetical protein